MMFTTMPEILRGIYFQQRLRLSGHLNMLQLIDEEILFIRQAINCALLQSYRKPHFPHLLLPGSCAITALHRERHSNLPQNFQTARFPAANPYCSDHFLPKVM